MSEPNPLALAARNQRAAADALSSVWVSASAGTGKTKVLTDRVLSLLITRPDLEPHRILCLTYTRAAAAEMATRTADRLGGWALATDGTLEAELEDLIGLKPSARQIARARQLLAQVLDTPGGMNIMTIHAFCQSLLRRFPLEADLAPHFALVEDRDAKDMLAAVLEEVLADIGEASPLAEAMANITRHVRDGDKFESLIGALTSARGRIKRLFERTGGLDGAIAATYRALGLSCDETVASIVAAASDEGSFDAAGLRRACPILLDGAKTDRSHGEIIADWLAKSERSTDDFELYCDAYLVQDRTRIFADSRLITKKIVDGQPDIAEIVRREAERVLTVCERLRSAEIAAASAALLTVGWAILARFERRKSERGLVDYDDLIAHTAALLQQPGVAPWVLYKLDGGIDHVLIDEAQDTSPAAWSIVRTLAEEFFAGVGQRDVTRTVFAVGDLKQSIYSFQGADPRSFREMRAIFETRANAAEARWNPVELHVSFRSTAPVLQAVDAVFAQTDARDGVAFDEDIVHIAERIGHGGLVELWPVVSPHEAEPVTPWKPPVERIRADSAQTRLARLIARRIERMVKDGEILESAGRPIRAGDIMVLVRHRTGFVDDLVRALKELSIEVAGVDRLHLVQHIAIMDLMALGRVALLPEDDLTLASVLKGPIIDLSEDQLFDLAHDRTGTLWDALRNRAQDDAAYGAAYEALSGVMARADRMAPFELYSDILSGPLRGREKLLARLGPDAADPIAEFVNLALAYERAHVPNLEGFLHWLEVGDVEIKRDLDQGEGKAVRVLTVHGAKGLEAPIVFLPDTTQMPRANAQFFWPEYGGEESFVWAPRRALHDPLCDRERETTQQDQLREYRRLLYVAMTRPRDRLYVCGWRGRSEIPDGSWYKLIERGLASVARSQENSFLDEFDETDGATVLHLSADQTAAPRAEKTDIALAARPFPGWAREAAPKEESPPRPLAPSRPDDTEPPVVSPLGADLGLRFRRGRLIHGLLQTLPEIESDRREAAARRFIARPAHGLTIEEQDSIVAETLAVLADPASAFLFGPGSRAEVPIVGRYGHTIVSAQLDRIAVTEERVSLVDFKTNRPPPRSVDGVPEIYLRQLAIYRALLARIYPVRRIDCYLLWTDAVRLMHVPGEILEPWLPQLDDPATPT